MTKKKWTIYGAIATALVITVFSVNTFADDNAWVEEDRAREVKALVDDILSDADDRAMFQGNGSSVSVNLHGFLQSRWTYNAGGDTDASSGFSLNRSRLILSGDVYNWSYEVSGQWNDGGDFTLMDAYGTTDFAGLDFKFGQFKSPFMREVLVSDIDTLAADRSIVSNTFGQGRSQGIEFGRDLGALDVHVAYTDGFNTDNGAGVDNGYALTGRAELELSRWWDIGAAISWNDLDTTDYWTYTVDTGVALGIVDLTAAYVGVNRDAGDDWATTVQASFDLTGNCQPFVQYEYGRLESETEDLSVITVGTNIHLNDNVRWTTGVGYSLNGISSGWDVSDSGWNTGTEVDEYVISSQITVQF